MIKIQKAMTYPKAADMMQLLDANTEEYLPLKIIVCENKVGKIEFFAEEMKKENGISPVARKRLLIFSGSIFRKKLTAWCILYPMRQVAM